MSDARVDAQDSSSTKCAQQRCGMVPADHPGSLATSQNTSINVTYDAFTGFMKLNEVTLCGFCRD